MRTTYGLALLTKLTLAFIGILAVLAVAAMSAPVEADAEINQVTIEGVYRLSDASAVGGASSVLARDDQGITMTLQTSDLEPVAAYTVWWVIFNDPEQCENGHPGQSACGLGDLLIMGGNPAVNSSVLYAAGNVTGGTGIGNFGARLQEGELSTVPGQVVFGPGLLDSEEAEVHLVVRTHGEVISSLEEAQITTFGGGCTPETDPTGVGPVGPNVCADQQYVVHSPASIDSDSDDDD